MLCLWPQMIERFCSAGAGNDLRNGTVVPYAFSVYGPPAG